MSIHFYFQFQIDFFIGCCFEFTSCHLADFFNLVAGGANDNFFVTFFVGENASTDNCNIRFFFHIRHLNRNAIGYFFIKYRKYFFSNNLGNPEIRINVCPLFWWIHRFALGEEFNHFIFERFNMTGTKSREKKYCIKIFAPRFVA